ncbi:MAG: AAA family ATPase [Coriobacteriales bacterium]|nr:AAA family ATPase [Coriobacteriales bacterium]
MDGTAHPLDEPFMVLATQSPIEQVGASPVAASRSLRWRAPTCSRAAGATSCPTT